MTLRDTAAFERTVWRGVIASGAMVLFAPLFFGGYLRWSDVTLWPALVPGVLLAVATGRGQPWGLLGAGAFLAPLCGLLGAPHGAAFSGAALGATLVWARLHAVHADPPWQTTGRIAAGAAAGGVLGALAEVVAAVFLLRLEQLGVPPLPAFIFVGAASGLLLSVAQLPAHFAEAADALAERVRALRPSLSDGRLRSLALEAVALHKDCAVLTSKLPRHTTRAELVASLFGLVSGALDQAERLASLLARGDASRLEAGQAHVARLEADLEEADDAVVRQHLEVALDAAREELARVEAMRIEQARLWARLEAEVALLGRARASLEDVQGGRQALQSAELTALSRKLESLSRSQALEADVMAEVAVGAELDQLAGGAAARGQLARG